MDKQRDQQALFIIEAKISYQESTEIEAIHMFSFKFRNIFNENEMK
jgi:hypothetical protein